MEKTIEEIAKKILKLETLDARNSDRLDFIELPVWDIKEALEAAYKAGEAEGFEAGKRYERI